MFCTDALSVFGDYCVIYSAPINRVISSMVGATLSYLLDNAGQRGKIFLKSSSGSLVN